MQAHIESNRDGRRGLGTTGKLVVGGTVSTGLLLGGFAVAGMALVGRMNGGALVETSVGLFVVGAMVGLMVSLAMGLIGRPAGSTMREAARDAGIGAVLAIPSCLFGLLVAAWMGMAVIGLYLGNVFPIAGSGLAALVAVAIMAATFRVTVRAGGNAIQRVRQVA